MNTCDTCQWWGDKRSADLKSPRLTCTNPALGMWSQDRIREDGAHCESAFRHHPIIVEIKTGPKFGCVHHVPKPPYQPTYQPTPDESDRMANNGES